MTHIPRCPTEPICECNEWGCAKPLEITWEEYLPHKGLYISVLCAEPQPKLPVIEKHPTYTIYELNETTFP